jgi:multiple sugar transport system substrate-binding protein
MGGLLLAACGGEPASSEKLAQSSAPVTFQYWDWAAVWQDLVGQLANSYTAKHRNVTVQWEVASDYWTKLQVAIAGDTAPDSWRMNGPNLPSWATLGLIDDIATYVGKDKDAAAALNAMAPAIVDYTKRGGKQWTMPFGQAISGIIAYNEDMIRAEGLTPPAALGSGRWTWPLLQEYAIKLTRRDGSRHGFFASRNSETGWLPFVNANGGSLFDKDGKRSAINTVEARDALEYLADLSAKHQVSPTPQDIAQENAVNRFLNGRLAMLPQGSWEIKDLNLKAKDLKWDLVPVPAAPRTRKNGGTNQMASIAMAKSSKQKDTVWQWQKFIGSKEGQDIIARAEYFPARLDSAEQIYYKPELGPANRPLLRDVLNVVQPLPWLDIAGNTAGWGPIVNPLINQMFDGQLGIRDGVQQMHDQLNASIERGFR